MEAIQSHLRPMEKRPGGISCIAIFKIGWVDMYGLLQNIKARKYYP